MDPLSPLITRFALNARVFYSGALCGAVDFDHSRGLGFLHVLRRGPLRVIQPGQAPMTIDEPSLMFVSGPSAHRFEVDDRDGAELVCAFIDFGSGTGNPLLRSMPNLLVVPLNAIPGVEATLALLFDEAFEQQVGRDAAVDRLAEYFVVLLLRHVISVGVIAGGVLAALGEPKLAKALMAIHEHPEFAWTVESLASKAGMSRSRFALHFRDTVGAAPLDYLTEWRISVAQTLLRRGKPLKVVAPAVGYASPAAFARVFSKRVGVSPIEWLAR